MTQVRFKYGLRYEINDTLILHIQKRNHKYLAAVLDTVKCEIKYSKEYLKAESLNNFTKQYGIELTF